MPKDGVRVPREAIERSAEIKKKRHRTFLQTEIGRDTLSLEILLAKMIMKLPRRSAKISDTIMADINDAEHCIRFALKRGDEEVRCHNLDYAEVIAESLEGKAILLHNLGMISKAEQKDCRKLAQRVAGQCIRLRDYYKSQGLDANVKSL